jgi:hypothetical protein
MPYLAHANVYGVIVERGAGDPAEMDALRKKVGTQFVGALLRRSFTCGLCDWNSSLRFFICFLTCRSHCNCINFVRNHSALHASQVHHGIVIDQTRCAICSDYSQGMGELANTGPSEHARVEIVRE